MTDLISRQAAIDALDERCESECEYSKKQRSVMCNACYLGSAKEVVENLPTIDPVKHGKWMVIPQRCDNQTFDECKCSVCGVVEYFNSGWKKFSYCPNCGARMDL